MSNLFSRLNVISQSQHDAEIDSPPVARRTVTLFPRAPNIDALPDDDPKPLPPTKVPADSSGWIKRRTPEEVEEFQDQLAITAQKKRMEHLEAINIANIAKLKVGVEVWTRHKEVANLSPIKGPKGQRRIREKTFGTIVEKSTRNGSFWNVKFHNDKTIYCSDSILTFNSDIPQGQYLNRDDNNNLCLEPTTLSFEEKDKIKTEIVLSKIYKLPGYTKINYETLAAIHKKKHPWINAWKLRFHVSKCRSQLLPKALPDSWITKLSQKTTEDDEMNNHDNNAKLYTTPSIGDKLNTKSDVAPSSAVCNNETAYSNKNELLAKKFLSDNIKRHRNINYHRYPYTHYKCLRADREEYLKYLKEKDQGMSKYISSLICK